MARVYVRSITRRTMYQKSSISLAGTDVWKISSVACGFAMSASRYITSASRYHPRYESRPSMCIRGLIPRNFAELAAASDSGLLVSRPIFFIIIFKRR